MNPWWLYARSRNVYAVLAILLCTAILGALASPELVNVPVRNTATTLIYPLLATVPGLALGASLASPCRELEKVSPISSTTLRATWISAIAAVSAAVVFLSLGGGFGLSEVVLRNHLLALGLTAAAAIVLPPVAAWLPVGALVAANGIYGTIDMVATAKWWAVLQHPEDSPGALITALTIGIVGPLLWIWRGSKS